MFLQLRKVLKQLRDIQTKVQQASLTSLVLDALSAGSDFGGVVSNLVSSQDLSLYSSEVATLFGVPEVNDATDYQQAGLHD